MSGYQRHIMQRDNLRSLCKMTDAPWGNYHHDAVRSDPKILQRKGTCKRCVAAFEKEPAGRAALEEAKSDA